MKITITTCDNGWMVTGFVKGVAVTRRIVTKQEHLSSIVDSALQWGQKVEKHCSIPLEPSASTPPDAPAN